MGVSMEVAALYLSKCGPPRADHNIIDLHGNEVSIGRSAETTHKIFNRYLSKVHAVLRLVNQAMTVEDLNSSNGTFVNETKLTAFVPSLVHVGDEIGFGMPVWNRNENDNMVYRVCKNEIVVAEGSRPNDGGPEQCSVLSNVVKQEVMLADEATPSTSTSAEIQPNHMESARRPIPLRDLVIKLQRCDDVDYRHSDLKRSCEDNMWRVVHSDSEDSDDDITVRRKRIRMVVSSSDESDMDCSTPRSPVLRKTKVTTKVTSPIRKRNCEKNKEEDDDDVIDLCSDEDDDAKADSEFGGYSQEDYVITISDDDDDEDVIATYVERIKLEAKNEPEDLAEFNEVWSRTCDEANKRMDEVDDIEATVAALHGDRFEETEPQPGTSGTSFSRIRPFVADEESSDEQEDTSDEDVTSEFLPQNSCDSEEEIPDAVPEVPVTTMSIPSPRKSLYSIKSLPMDRLKISSKTPITDHLTKAQPMHVRRRSGLTKPAAQFKPTPFRTAEEGLRIPAVKKKSLRQIVLEQSDKRLRVAGGGSDVPMKGSNPVKRNHQNVPKKRVDDEDRPKRVEKKSVAVQAKPVHVDEKRAHKVTQPDRSSRSSLLAADMLQPPTPSVQKKKPASSNGSPNIAASLVTSPTVVSAPFILPDVPSTSNSGPNKVSENGVGRRNQQSPVKHVTFADNNRVHTIPALERAPRHVHRQPVAPIPNRVNPRQVARPQTDNIDTVLAEVLKWNILWFEEQKTRKELPPILNQNELLHTKFAYESSEEYVKTYRPLILLETWEEVATCISPKKQSFIMDFVGVSTPPPAIDPRALLMHFHAVLPVFMESSDDFPNAGWLVQLKLPLRSSSSNEIGDANVLAYIVLADKMPYTQFLRSETPSILLERHASNINGEKLLVKITLKISCIPLDLKKDVRFKMTLITKFGKCVERFEALANISNNPLGTALLRPQRSLCTLPSTDPRFQMKTQGSTPFSQEQVEVITRVTTTCILNPTVPKVAVIRGSPGTGKTSIIGGIIAELIYGANVTKETKPLILLCAPSRNTVDDNIQRLRQLRHLKVIRFGEIDDETDQYIRGIHFDNLLKKDIIRTNQKNIGKLTSTLESRRQQLSRKRYDDQSWDVVQLRKGLQRNEENLALLESKLQSYLNHSKKPTLEERELSRENLIINAEVIATTLASCSQAVLNLIQQVNNRPIVCIVDEATHCTEPDLLPLLQENITKLVLFGDPHQLLANVRSETAKRLGYRLSLFERLFKNFPSIDGPVISLNVQHRMHTEICRFPSMSYYGNRLATDIAFAKRVSNCQLIPYTVFNIQDSHDQKHELDFSNPREATFICRLVQFIIETNPTSKIGIITYYPAQRNLLKRAINESAKINWMNASSLVEIDMVEGFQGREKDIVIVSTVRAQSADIGAFDNANLMNVAITRARHALIVCGHQKSLQICSNWKILIQDADRRRRLFTLHSEASESVIGQNINRN